MRSGAAASAGAGIGAAAGSVLVIAAWVVIGPSRAVFPVVVTCSWFGVAALIGSGLAELLPQRWFLVSRTEVRWHRRLRVDRFDRALEVLGWNRVVRRMRGGPEQLARGGLQDLQWHVRSAAAGHAVGALVHLSFGLACLLVGAWGSATVLIAAGALLHVWPALLQRSTLARIRRIPPGCW